jgi:hypothetical protein
VVFEVSIAGCRERDGNTSGNVAIVPACSETSKRR